MKLSEVVIDGRDKFQKRRQKQVAAKAEQLAKDLPDALKKQQQLEYQIALQLDEIQARANRMLKPFVLEIAGLIREYTPETPLIKVVMYELATSDSDTNRELAHKFVMKHKPTIVSALKMMLSEINQLQDRFDKEDWPTKPNWVQYTKVNEVKYEIQLHLNYIDQRL